MDSTTSRSFSLADRITIGRDKKCNIVLEYPHVSRLHCEVVREPLGYVLKDHSQNGTYRAIQVKAQARSYHKLTVRTRSGYYAGGTVR